MISPAPVTRTRLGALTLVFVCVLVNYMDRANIAMAGPLLREELGLSRPQMGLVFSAFGWTYCLFQIPGGILVDLVPVRKLYGLLIFLWSAATILQGWANSLIALTGCRMAIGVLEAPSYPANNKIVTRWFPTRERASAIAVYTSGQFLGLSLLTPLLFALQAQVGWRGLFFVTGGVGLLWSFAMHRLYRDPLDHPKLARAELDYIEQDGGLVRPARARTPPAATERKRFNWRDVRTAFSLRQLWGVYLGQFCLGAAFQFFLTWFPTYLKEYRGLSLLSTGYWGSVPYFGAFLGVLLAGFSSDFLLKRGCPAGLARKLPVLCGMLLMMVVIGANYTDKIAWVIFFMTLSFFGNGLASIGWVFVSSLAPLRLLGVVGGVFNFCGSLSGATMPAIIGWLARDGNFGPALVFIAAMSAIGFCSYLFLVGDVKRIELPEPGTRG
jgi:ACS family D-galactonate transporter-like MFS transporter